MTNSAIFDASIYKISAFLMENKTQPAVGNGRFNARTRGIKYGLGGALAIAAIIGANPANAAVQVTNVQLAGPGGYYTVNINGENVYDAALVLTIDNSEIFANCDDIYHNIYLGQNTTFNVGPFSAAVKPSNFNGGSYNPAQVGAMSWLLGTGAAIWKAGPGNPSEQLDLAALQLASWMVGNPKAVFSNYDAKVYAAALSYIAQSAGKSALPGQSVEQLSSDYGVQGQIVESPATPAVPEPSTWALMLAGFGMVGHAMRHRLGVRSQSLAYA